MSARSSCDDLRALAPELALGIASGDERARALEHLASCPACRHLLDELSRIADELLLLSPNEEPPAGFETRVLGELPRPTRRRRWLRPLVPAVAAVAAALVAATGVWLSSQDDRDLASRYRETLAEANGKYLAAEALTAPGGQRVGTVFGYEGEPSWVLEDGERRWLDPVRVAHRGGSGGESIPIDFHEISEVRLIGPGRGNVLQAGFGS
jgi:Putative zinc-finger